MHDIICNTSPLQYLHQLDLLHILRSLAGQVIVPPAVMQELAEGLALGVNLPDLNAQDWIIVRRPLSQHAVMVTANTREFERVPDLKMENWLVSQILTLWKSHAGLAVLLGKEHGARRAGDSRQKERKEKSLFICVNLCPL